MRCFRSSRSSVLAGNEACRRPPHSLGYRMGISEIILVSLPERLRIRGRNLLHVVAKRKLTSNVVRRQPRFDAKETGGKFASLDVMRPRETFSRNMMAPPKSRPIM